MIGFVLKAVFLYAGASFVLGYFPVNSCFQPDNNGIEIYIVSNGVHTDFVLPVRNVYKDWKSLFREDDFPDGWEAASHIAFGWGDQGFYLKTPEWKDLTFGTAIIAVLIPSKSAMHVTLWNEPSAGKNIRKVLVSDEAYNKLTNYIVYSFELNDEGQSILIDHPGYGSFDRFYESRYRFHLLRTCNVWTTRGLQKAGITTGIWSPFDKAILYHLSGIQ